MLVPPYYLQSHIDVLDSSTFAVTTTMGPILQVDNEENLMSHFWKNLVKDRQVACLTNKGVIGPPGKYYFQNKPASLMRKNYLVLLMGFPNPV